MIYDATLSFQAFEPAIQSDSRYEDWRNPHCYEKENGLAVQEGELLLKVVVLDVNNPAAAENFPDYVPISILVQASLNQNQIALRGVNYLVRANDENGNAFKLFMFFLSQENQLYDHEDQLYITYSDEKRCFPIEEYYLKYRLAKAEKCAEYLFKAPFQQIYDQCNQKWEVLTNTSLETRYKKVTMLGSGAQGVVYEVEHVTTGAIKAMKISDVHIAKDLFPCIQFLQTFMPHLTRIEETFKLDGTPFHNKQCCVMERMKGQKWEIVKKTEQIAAFKVQEAATSYLLAKFKIQSIDVHTGNILYKKLDDRDEHRGKKLKNYDFWMYRIEEYTFYIPQPKYLIKFADYDSWKAYLFKAAVADFSTQWIHDLSPHTPKELALIFSKPEGVSEDKILEI